MHPNAAGEKEAKGLVEAFTEKLSEGLVDAPLEVFK
jgi:hypothetical protein